MSQNKQKHPFRVVESYKHRLAKDVLRQWFEDSFIVEYEKEFYIDNKIVFVADVILSCDDILQAIYEITHKHPLTGKKLELIQYWSYINSMPVNIYEIGADYILNKTEKPLIIYDQIID